jgi:hypothetical protein
MTERAVLLKEIDALPPEYVNEVVDFVAYLRQKNLKKTPETMLLGEKTLAAEWDMPEEDEAWADL